MSKSGRPDEAKKCYETAAVGTDEPSGMMYYNDKPADVIYYQGAALEELGRYKEAKKAFSLAIEEDYTHIKAIRYFHML